MMLDIECMNERMKLYKANEVYSWVTPELSIELQFNLQNIIYTAYTPGLAVELSVTVHYSQNLSKSNMHCDVCI